MIRPRIAPWLYKSQRLLGRPARNPQQVAARSWVVAPGVTEAPYDIFIKQDHFDRIIAEAFGKPRETLLEMIKPAKHVAEPTKAYLLRDVTLSGGCLYSGMYKEDLYPPACEQPKKGERREAVLDSAVFAGLYTSSRWFGHLLHDEFPLQLLAADHGKMVAHRRRVYADEPRWRELLNLPHPPTYDAFFARELIWMEDFAQNPSKRQRYAEMRRRLQHLPPGHQRIYLRRSNSGGETRRLINEDELITRLEREGFTIVEPAAIGVNGVIDACMDARLALSVDGSHAAPLYYAAADNAHVMFMIPPQRVTPIAAYMSIMHGMRGGMFIGEPVANDPTAFSVDIDEMMRTLEEFCAT
ncbi:MAG TPA: glycosyltransferase 61 family protein [Tepidisphaeraceae bacterium]